MNLKILIMIFVSFSVHPLDERSYLDLTGSKMSKGSIANQFTSVKKDYYLDLDSDGTEDRIRYIKNIHQDVIESKYGRFEFPALGSKFKIERIRLVDINKQSRTLIVFFTEGIQEKIYFQKELRVYFISFEKKKTRASKLFRAAHIFYENELISNQYNRRHYRISVADLDSDGVNEIISYYNHISQIYKYNSNKNEWRRL